MIVIVAVVVAVVGTDDHYDCDEALELSESYQSSLLLSQITYISNKLCSPERPCPSPYGGCEKGSSL